MKKIFNSINFWISSVGRSFAREWSLVLKDIGVLLFFLALPLLYPIAYTLIYNPEVVEQLPVAVVDNSRSAKSREFIRQASAAPAIQIYGYADDLAQARRWVHSGDVYGVLFIPRDYAKNLGSGRQADVEFYADMSLLLRYRALLSALTELQIKITGDVTMSRVEQAGAAGTISMPINSSSNFLGDTEQGFASFIMPGIVILILQQSMLLGITFIGGTSRERRLRNGGVDPLRPDSMPVSADIWGRALCYTVFYLPMTLYVVKVIPEMFSLPHYGSAVDYLPFLLPMLIATAFLGQALTWFIKERETPFLIIVFTSVVFLFLSGLTWPRYAMSQVWYWAGNLVPATWGIEGFIRINSNGATLAESSRPFIAMWILSDIYFIAAWVVVAAIRRRARRQSAVAVPATDRHD